MRASLRALSFARTIAFALAVALPLLACDSTDPAPQAPTLDAAIAAQGNLTLLSTALGATGLDAVLRSPEAELTVFAPTDAAFAALLQALGITAEQLLALDGIDGVLLYHATTGSVRAGDLSAGQTVTTARPSGAATFRIVASGSGFGIDTNGDGQANARIVTTNIEASNGVVHIIDNVLIPSDFMAGPSENLAEVVGGREDLTVLTTALGATGLDAALAGDDELTVFAPTDAAFAALLSALGISAAELLALDGIDGVLLYHVTSGSVRAGDISVGQTVTTARPAGAATFRVVSASGGGLGIDTNGDGQADARIVTTDIEASNGVVHIIDAVLLPPDFG
jgi:transforming growth factor-beta-induced protein